MWAQGAGTGAGTGSGCGYGHKKRVRVRAQGAGMGAGTERVYQARVGCKREHKDKVKRQGHSPDPCAVRGSHNKRG